MLGRCLARGWQVIVAPIVSFFERAWSVGVRRASRLTREYTQSQMLCSLPNSRRTACATHWKRIPWPRRRKALPFFAQMLQVEKNSISSGLNKHRVE